MSCDVDRGLLLLFALFVPTAQVSLDSAGQRHLIVVALDQGWLVNQGLANAREVESLLLTLEIVDRRLFVVGGGPLLALQQNHVAVATLIIVRERVHEGIALIYQVLNPVLASLLSLVRSILTELDHLVHHEYHVVHANLRLFHPPEHRVLSQFLPDPADILQVPVLVNFALAQGHDRRSTIHNFLLVRLYDGLQALLDLLPILLHKFLDLVLERASLPPGLAVVRIRRHVTVRVCVIVVP